MSVASAGTGCASSSAQPAPSKRRRTPSGGPPGGHRREPGRTGEAVEEEDRAGGGDRSHARRTGVALIGGQGVEAAEVQQERAARRQGEGGLGAPAAGAELAGLLLNAAPGWWADPLAALIIVCDGAREGVHARREAGARSRGPALPRGALDHSYPWSVASLAGWKARARALKRDTYALYLACRDPRVPWYAKALAAAVVAYALSPIDLIPDFIPVLGYLDDLVLVPLGLALVLRLIPAPVMAECRREASARLAAGSGRPHSWIGAAVIVAVWLLLAGLAVWLVLRATRVLG